MTVTFQCVWDTFFKGQIHKIRTKNTEEDKRLNSISFGVFL